MGTSAAYGLPGYLRFWGKAQPSVPGSPSWHPAAYHCLDVAAAAQELLISKVSRPPPPWDRAEHVPAFAALLALHDIGKFTRPFQAKVETLWPKQLGPWSAPPSPSHDTAGYLLMAGPLAAALDGVLTGWRSDYRLPVLRAICGHHGRPPSEDADLAPKVACGACLSAAQDFIGDVTRVLNPAPLPAPPRGGGQALGWWLAGFAVLADWIGSAEAWFPYCRPDLSVEAYWQEVAVPRARCALAASGVLPAPIRRQVTLSELVGATAIASPVQSLSLSLDLGREGPFLTLIEDQTGSGKTEAALLLAHRLMAVGRADGLFVALPTMATANAMYGRLADAYLRLFADGASPSLVLTHGRRTDHRGFQDSILRDAAVPTPAMTPPDETGSAQCAAWIADDLRRAFLAAVGVGTIDQALLAVLPTRHPPLRLHGLHRRVLLIDEAHAYDAYMREELLRLVAFQAGMGGCVIVLSATLPQTTRRKLTEAFAAGAGTAPIAPVRDAYPLITTRHGTATAVRKSPVKAEAASPAPFKLNGCRMRRRRVPVSRPRSLRAWPWPGSATRSTTRQKRMPASLLLACQARCSTLASPWATDSRSRPRWCSSSERTARTAVVSWWRRR